MKTRFPRFALTVLTGLTLAPALAPIVDPIVDCVISREAILHDSPTTALLSLLMLALLFGTLATRLTNMGLDLLDGRPRINLEP
jgi:hypothetical protein